jgi:hypothetical protein
MSESTRNAIELSIVIFCRNEAGVSGIGLRKAHAPLAAQYLVKP